MVVAAVTDRLRGASGHGLSEDDFWLTNESGFGDGLNNYAHSMAWFEDRLYVGTTRGTFAMMKSVKPLPNLVPWPVECPDDVYDVDRRAEIWRYDPPLDQWVRIYQAAWVPGRNNREVPRYVGFRGMTVFQGKGDSKPCLYVSTWAPAIAEPPDILRCENGSDFESVPRPPWDTSVRSFRSLQVFKGRVHTSPTGSRSAAGQAQEVVGSEATIYCTDDIRSAQWTAAGPEGFGQRGNVTVFEMAEFNDHLYAATVNLTGMQIWKTDGEGGPPYQWRKVIDRGAWRGPLNEVGVSMHEFRGALYIGTGIANGGYHRTFNIGPASCELIRLWPDDSWDLCMGSSRLTPDGAKVPLSGYSPGFDNLFNGYLWRLMAHDGHLYAGTLCWASMLPYLPINGWPEEVLVMVRRWGKEELNRRYGGFNLWRSPDGIRWDCVTRSGFGNKYNWGVRNMASTPHGLFVGSANVFGPKVAIQREGRWQYVHNPRGGTEIFLGSPPNADA